jgi:Uma2 family endonuclease
MAADGMAAFAWDSLTGTIRAQACYNSRMNIALRKPRMSRDQFFEWAEAQDGRYEFDGFKPVAMTGGTVRHDLLTRNIGRALDARLKGGCRAFGPNAAVRTVGDAVRYPDALVTCSKVDETAREVPGVVVVFEVLSPTSGHVDRIVKLLEYRAVPSIRRYVIVEHATPALTVYSRADAGADWIATALTRDETLALPEIGITVPVIELFASTDIANEGGEEQPDDAAT